MPVKKNNILKNTFFYKKRLDNFKISVIIISVVKNIAELCKGSTADSDSVCLGSNPSSAAKKKHFPKGSVSFCVCVRMDTTSFASLLATSFSRRLISFRISGHKTMLPSANSVVLRTNDVALPTMLHCVQIYAIIHSRR